MRTEANNEATAPRKPRRPSTFVDVEPVVAARMRRIPRTNTTPEIAVRRLAHRMGYRFRLHRRDLPGTPDVVFPSHRKVILVHGCFWHQHPGCPSGRLPRTRVDYWGPKLARNVERDAKTLEKLEEVGWEPMVVWECETKDEGTLQAKLADFLGG